MSIKRKKKSIPSLYLDKIVINNNHLNMLREHIQEVEESYWADGKKKSAYLEGLKHALDIMTGTHPSLLKWEL